MNTEPMNLSNVTQDEFERKAKEEVAAAVYQLSEGRLHPSYNELKLVFFAYILGGMKATVYVPGSNYYGEVTFNFNKKEFYVDIYDKVLNYKV